MGTRLKGQEVRCDITSPQGRETALGDVVSCGVTFQMEILKQGFLGETTDRKDDIFRGLEGEMELQLEQKEALSFIAMVKDRATRRTAAGGRISITFTMAFAEGGSARIQLPNVFFGNLPVNVGGRDEYVTLSLTFEADDGKILFVN